MNAHALEKRYHNLTPGERWPLIVQAALRGDERERLRLVDSAGSKTWSLPDHWGQADAFRELESYHFRAQLARAADFWWAVGNMSGIEDIRHQETALHLARMLAYIFLAHADGWRLFCKEIGIDAEALSAKFPEHDTLQHAEQAMRRAAYTPEGMVKRSRPTDPSARLVTAEGMALTFKEAWKQLMEPWGGRAR